MCEKTQSIEAEGLDVIVVGSFNPAIFHPEWFLRHNLIGDQDSKDDVELKHCSHPSPDFCR